MNVDQLVQYADAWNAHDIDHIMSFHTPDTVFETGGGEEKYGTRFCGYDVVRQRFIEVWTELPDAQFENCRHFISGDRGCSEWTFSATGGNGAPIEINGCDLFTFRDDLIAVKNSLLKNRR